ncbi:hypothetical protein [Desulforhopalus vacuolatus]|uniref:hypothetical protein n=1 Tax=Desulforhopalus vacuolatus TaxID=40414 RepID=UPI001F0693D3|nr:hypothetical protein [Desulforhopalus vacuolatus]
MEYEIEKTESFDKWLKKLRDRKAVLAITASMLCGGDKSTQKKDINKAKEIAQTI